MWDGALTWILIAFACQLALAGAFVAGWACHGALSGWSAEIETAAGVYERDGSYWRTPEGSAALEMDMADGEAGDMERLWDAAHGAGRSRRWARWRLRRDVRTRVADRTRV